MKNDCHKCKNIVDHHYGVFCYKGHGAIKLVDKDGCKDFEPKEEHNMSEPKDNCVNACKCEDDGKVYCEVTHRECNNSETCQCYQHDIYDDTQRDIVATCDRIKSLLLDKNRKYGDSALNPCRIFAKSDAVEQIKVRIDDKINRIRNAQTDEDEDVVMDLAGYLVLLMIAKERDNGKS